MATTPRFAAIIKAISVVVISSVSAIINILWKTLRNGPKKVFGTVKRDIRPDILDDPSFGTHGFARLKVRKIMNKTFMYSLS